MLVKKVDVNYLNPRKGTETVCKSGYHFLLLYTVNYLNPRKGTETL